MQGLKKPSSEVLKKYDELGSQLRKAQTHKERSMYLREMSHISAHYDLSDKSFKHCGKIGVKDASGKIIIPALFDGIGFVGSKEYRPQFIPVLSGNKWGLLNLHNRKVHEATIFDHVQYIYHNRYFAVSDGNKAGVIDSVGNIIVPIEMDKIYNFCNSIAVLVKNGKYGMLSYDGRFIEPIFDSIEGECDCFVSVTYNGKEGYINKDGLFTECYDEAFESTFI